MATFMETDKNFAQNDQEVVPSFSGSSIEAEDYVSSEGAEAKTDTKTDELNKYWKAVEENPTDFTGWTYLLQFVEQECDIDNGRKAYEAFFSHYPYCYGYWKKYSDLEKKAGNMDKAVEVFEKGLRAIPLSVELWLHYINFYIAEFSSSPDSKSKIKSLYQKALASAGLEFRSDKLYDSYINWQTSQGDFKAVTVVFEKLIRTPTQLYSHHWDNYCCHINKNHPKDFLDLDTFLKLRSQVVNKNGHEDEEDDDVGLDEAMGIDVPGVDAPPGQASPAIDDREVKKIKAKYIEQKELIYKANVEKISQRWTFEESIRRPYFHVKPLERGQLKNWREYLDFEISLGDHNRVVVLFERCMISCALYEDFWMKYAKYLEQHSMEGVRSVYQRACDIHLPKKPYIHLSWAAFEERRDNYPLARKILMNIENNVPGLAMVCMRRISLERRQKNHQAAEDLFKAYIEKAVNNKTRTFYSIKYARYMQKVVGDPDKARNILVEVLDHDKTNEKAFLQLLDVEYQTQPISEERTLDAFQRLLSSEVSLEFKVKISQRRMEFLDDFGTCIQKITEAYDEHQKLMKEVNSKKKSRPEREQILPEEPPEKKQKIEPPSNKMLPMPVDSYGAPPPSLMGLQAPPPPSEAPPYGYSPWPGDSYPPSHPSSYPYSSYPSSYPPSYNYYGH